MDIQERHMKTSYECLSFAQIISYAYQDKEYFQGIIRNAERAVDLVAFMKVFFFLVAFMKVLQLCVKMETVQNMKIEICKNYICLIE